jgi:hypothetical protein
MERDRRPNASVLPPSCARADAGGKLRQKELVMNRSPLLLLALSLGCAPPTATPFQQPHTPDAPVPASPLPAAPGARAPATAAKNPPAAPECLTEEPPLRVEASVKMIDPGKPPLSALRYRPRAGSRQTMVYEVSSLVDAGAAIPRTEFAVTLGLSVVETKAESAKFSFAVSRVDVPSKPGTSPEVIQGIRAGLLPWEGASGKGEVSLLGVIDTVALSDRASPQLRAALEAAIGQLPKEPVGAGARWQIVSAIHTGLVLRGMTEFELVSIAGERATIRHKMTLNSDPAPGPVICLGQEEKIQSLSFRSEGSGERTVRLSQLSAERFKDTSVVHTETRATKGDRAEVIAASIEAVTTISSK